MPAAEVDQGLSEFASISHRPILSVWGKAAKSKGFNKASFVAWQYWP